MLNVSALEVRKCDWKTEKLFFNGIDFFDSLSEEIHQAQSTIDLESYIFDHDEIGKKIAALIETASARGVRVRVLVDGFGANRWASHFSLELLHAGVEFRVFHRIYFDLMKAFPIRWCRFVEILSRMLHRNHRKLCLIDQKTAYLGSMNISDTHLDFSDRSGSRDTGVRLTGTPLESLQHAFDRSWCPLGLGTPDHASSNEAVVAADSVFQKRQVYRLLLEEISRAEKRVWFTTAYFAPTLAFMAELKRAALRGVDVVILTTSESDAPVVKWFRTVCYSQLLKSGVQIYEYLPAVLHAKTSLIDDHARVGSSNLNYRSFFSDREVDVTLTHSESLAQLSQQFIRDLEQSKRMNPADWTSRALGDRCLGRLARLFRHWL